MTQKFPFDHFLKLDTLNEVLPSASEPKVSPVVLDQAVKGLSSSSSTAKISSEFSAEELKTITEAVLEHVKNLINPNKFHAYFAHNLTVSSIHEQSVEFVVSTTFLKKLIETHYVETLKQAVLEILGKHYDLTIQVLNTPALSLSSNSEGLLSEAKKVAQKTNTFMIQDLEPTREDLNKAVDSQVIEHINSSSTTTLDQNKTFANFVIGPSNNMAHALAIAVAKDPGKTYPALYIYGNSGLGKTHLSHAIANNIQTTKPGLRICMTSANRFMNEMIQAIHDNRVPDFRRKYIERTDVLIIDDVHELKHRTTTQDHFFHVFNELLERGKQLIFTSDKPPKEIDGIEERIRSRLSLAIPVEIQQPDLETRIAILKKKAVEKDVFISDDIVNLIAKCVKNNIRELEGCLVKLGAVTNILKMDLDLELAKEHLNLNEELENQKLLTIETIAKTVANYYKIPIGDLRGKAKTKEITLPRQVAMFLINKLIKPTLKENGQYFSNRDHTTVLHAVNTIRDRIKTEPILSQQVLDIEKSL